MGLDYASRVLIDLDLGGMRETVKAALLDYYPRPHNYDLILGADWVSAHAGAPDPDVGRFSFKDVASGQTYHLPEKCDASRAFM